MKVAIVVAQFYEDLASRLLEGALLTLREGGVSEDEISTHRVPGAFEVPQMALAVAAAGGVDAVVCLGAIVRGETDHHMHLGHSVADSIARAAQQTGVPMTFGVLTTNNMEQALARAGGPKGNKGAEAARAAVELAKAMGKL